MYRLVSCFERLPEKWTTYFVILDGRKDIVTIPWMQKHRLRYPEHEFFWLEEILPERPAKKKKTVIVQRSALVFSSSTPWEKP